MAYVSQIITQDMPLTRITYKIADEICSSNRAWFDQFRERAVRNEWFQFTHYNFFYSYPEFGKKWPNEQPCQYHRVETACNCCGKKPERNYAGVGTLYAYKSSNTRREEFVLFCSSCRTWRDSQEFKPQQPVQFKLL